MATSTAWTGLIIGIIFGIVLQRGRVCFNSAFRDIVLIKDNYVLKIGALAIAFQMIALLILAQFGLFKISAPGLNLVANIAGGYIFGLGMVLAGGCASGTTYRVGEGLTTAWFAAIFYGMTAMSTGSGALKPLGDWFKSFAIKNPSAMDEALYIKTSGPTVASLLGISPWIVGLVIAALLIWYVYGTKTTNRKTPINMTLLALLLTAVSMGAWWTRSFPGDGNYGLGITAGWSNLISGFTGAKPLNWSGLEIIGIIIGALIAALASKEFKFRMPKDPKTYLQVMIGGILMGFGASVAGGCNIGHFFTGVPTLALSSIIASVFFVLGNWTMVYFLYMRNKD